MSSSAHGCARLLRSALTRGAQARYAVRDAAAALARRGVACAGGVHFVSRLDRGTSGVLAAALSPAAARALQAVWADASVVCK